MPSSDSARDVELERLAAEFVARQRRGEHPPLSEYVERYPDLADDIRELFPALVQIEKLKPAADATRAFEPGAVFADGARRERLGDYRILREVGHGGMGVVYEAEQESLGRHVALKVLPSSALLNPTYLARFRREAKAAAHLHHTNIVPVFGTGECDGVPFYAMQFIRGEGLDKVLADVRRMRLHPGAAAPVTGLAEGSIAQSLLTGQFAATAADVPAEPLDRAAALPTSGFSVSGPEADYCRGVARIGVQVAEALAYAHRQGILHRDIKPSNLLLDQQGTVWVTDFGLAKAEGADDLTQAGDIVGTLRYMAPERFEGRSLPQSDVYALGVTLYEMLTLRPAFEDANKARLIDKVMHETPLSPRKISPHIPRDLETVVSKCLAKDPRGRYATAAALAEDLKRFLADRPIKARRTTAREHLWRWCRRNPAVATLSGALLLLLLVTAIGGVVMSLRLNEALGQARDDRDKARAAERQGKKQLLESLISDARARRFSGRVGQRFGTLEAIRKASALAHELEMPPATFDELRNLAIAALALPDIHMVKEWEGWPEGSHSIAFDDRLQRYARSDQQGNITVREVDDDREIARLPGRGKKVGIAFERDGQGLILEDETYQRQRWRFDANQTVSLLPLVQPGWSGRYPTSDGQLCALIAAGGTLRVYETSSGKRLRDISFGKGFEAWKDAYLYWDMHPWKHQLALALGPHADPERRVVRVLDLDRGTILAELPPVPWGYTNHLGWHPDGKTLAVGYDYAVVLWDVPTRRRIRVITGHKGGGLSAHVSRSGQLLSTFSQWDRAGGVRLWHPQTGKLLLSVPGESDAHVPAADGRLWGHRIRGTRLQLWAAEPSPVFRDLFRDPLRDLDQGEVGEYRRSAVHRDGRLVAVGTPRGVTLFDLANGLDVGHLNLGHNFTVQFDPATGDLLTFGDSGLLRWPVKAEATNPTRLEVGPPQRVLAEPGYDREFRLSNDGRTLAVARGSRALVLLPERGGQPVSIGPLQDTRQQIDLSPDGKWVATGSHEQEEAILWDARTGRKLKTLLDTRNSGVRFSPDGKWLVTNRYFDIGGTCRFWRVGSWEEGPQRAIKGGTGVPAFSPDSKWLALEQGQGALRLIDVKTGRDLALLDSPDQSRSNYTTFSPDGTLLITTNITNPALHVWDLRELRIRLKEMELDWEADEAPSPRKGEARVPRFPPLEIEVVKPEAVSPPHRPS